MDDGQYVQLLQAIREHAPLTLSDIAQAGEHGADAGWCGFTYTADGADFTRQNESLLDELLQQDADEYGFGNVAAFVGSFTRADMADTQEGYRCLIAWYALETVGHRLADRRYEKSNR